MTIPDTLRRQAFAAAEAVLPRYGVDPPRASQLAENVVAELVERWMGSLDWLRYAGIARRSEAMEVYRTYANLVERPGVDHAVVAAARALVRED